MNELEVLEMIERYLAGQMNDQERVAFEELRRNNPEIDLLVVEQTQFLNALKEFGNRNALAYKMEAIHSSIDVDTIKDQVEDRPPVLVRFWRAHHAKISVAASVTIFAILGTLFFTGYFSDKNHQSTYSALRRDIQRIRQSQNALIRNVKGDMTSPRNTVAMEQFGGTGFALSDNGYVVTNYHVVNGADSLLVQNASGSAFKAKTVYVDPSVDIAILQITDTTFRKLENIPYTFSNANGDLGEDVYTIGYPRDEIVFGKGYLSSSTGFNGDTIAYQVSIPVNPGNSGGPLLDNKGNVIGLISGKQTQADGAAFAIKTNYLLKAIQAIPADSLNEKLVLNTKNHLAGMSRTQQIKKLQNYIFMVKVYNKE
ncbi:MAG: trypsin-like peptidase domain-containing protein [Mucilaginibacter polytrichastri]|nr:trypsin-like peptidase domain-containing protein [Mucilaginibacter polytrichastri]